MKKCSACGGETRPAYENRTITQEGAGVIRLIGVPYHICTVCSNGFYDNEIENKLENLLEDISCPEGEKILLWSGNSLMEADTRRFQLPDYPDRYVKRPKRKVEI